MDDFILARVLHVLGVVLWIGGVAMVTTTLLPVIARMSPVDFDRTAIFQRIEKRFARQARFTTLLVGLSGFYMIHVLDAWYRFTEVRFWWMHAMVLVWSIFTLFLFVLEPRVLHKKVSERAQQDPEATLARMQRMHWILLSLSLITVAGAVAGSHGWSFF
ncbi:hypothetical protein [Nitrosomonas sp.]|uniref:hypothetical protein n=1 Tax=Nitrosomonas sp. TaxID=42353 RepID=UPI0025F50BE2|nr:hypothetical protein [Nitrosomonas sp.]MCC6916687.1 hypothetical protein [Nitrosomonas sp.]